MAVALLVLFLVCFSLATGALEAGKWNDGWHLSAIDTRGQCRLRLVVYKNKRPDLEIYKEDGRLRQTFTE
jgi:uncharacterized protein YeaC (DUF1315 family)